MVVYSDIGFASAPFRLVYPFNNQVNKLKYKHNFSPVLGFGIAYKWFSLRVGFTLKGTTRAVSRFGQSTYFDIGTQFQVKNWFFDLDARSFKGYAIKNAYKWNDTLNKLKPNDIRPNTQTASISINAWYFFNKNMNMSSIKGITGHYEKELGTFYLKPSVVFHGLSNDDDAIISKIFNDSLVEKTSASVYSAFDIGLVPGYAYVNRTNNWQYCAFFGLGGVIQAKLFRNDKVERGYLGLSPRYDIKLSGGYSVPKYFVFGSLDFDNRSIRFGNLKYRQNYFVFKITAGIRFDTKDKKKNSKD